MAAGGAITLSRSDAQRVVERVKTLEQLSTDLLRLVHERSHRPPRVAV